MGTGLIEMHDEVVQSHLAGLAQDYRVTYWTGWLSPEMEGCSKEVFVLKDHYARSRIFGFSRQYEVRASRRQRYFGMNVRWYPLFRLLAPLVEMRGDINHIYGSISEWYFLRVLGRRPIIMTIATEADGPLDAELYRYVRRFVTHARTAMHDLAHQGFDARRLRVIYPGIDLERFRPAPSRVGKRFRILFASSPNWVEGVESRGVKLLLTAAERLPDVEFHFLWRPLPGAEGLIRTTFSERKLDNVTLTTGVVLNMTDVYHASDATIAPFRQRSGMKTCPTSLMESLGCARPVLVSTKVGIADLVQEEECGAVFEPTVDGLCEAIERLRRRYQTCCRNARQTAERHFDLRDCLRHYDALYREVLAESNGDGDSNTPSCT